MLGAFEKEISPFIRCSGEESCLMSDPKPPCLGTRVGMWCVGLWCVGLWCVGLWCVGLWCVGMWCVGMWCVGLWQPSCDHEVSQETHRNV